MSEEDPFFENKNILIEENNNEDKQHIDHLISQEEIAEVGYAYQNDDDNEEKISEAIKELYNRTKDSNCLRKCMVKVIQKHMNVGKYMTSDEELGMMLLFSYDYMYLTHICISEFIETGKISDENIRKLMKALI